jgi:hypothetical protein
MSGSRSGEHCGGSRVHDMESFPVWGTNRTAVCGSRSSHAIALFQAPCTCMHIRSAYEFGEIVREYRNGKHGKVHVEVVALNLNNAVKVLVPYK